MYNVAYIFNKCLYFPYYITGHLLDRLCVSVCVCVKGIQRIFEGIHKKLLSYRLLIS